MRNDKIYQIPIDSIDDPKSPIRSRASDTALHQLADSIRDVGLIQPILVKPKNGRYEVVAGHRRLVACKLLGRLTVPCILRDVDDISADAIKLHENLCREGVNIVDQAIMIKRVMTSKNLTIPDMAKGLRRSETFIKDRLALLLWDPKVIDAVGLDKISFSAARWFAKITDPVTRLHYLDVGIRQGVSPRLARDWFRSWEQRRLPTPPPPEERIKSDDKEKIEYYNDPCQICRKPIEMGTEKVIFVHPKCLEAIEKDLPEIQE